MIQALSTEFDAMLKLPEIEAPSGDSRDDMAEAMSQGWKIHEAVKDLPSVYSTTDRVSVTRYAKKDGLYWSYSYLAWRNHEVPESQKTIAMADNQLTSVI